MCPLVTGLLAVLLAGAYTLADDEADLPRVEPEAKTLLDEVVAAYQALDTYADQGAFTARLEVDGESISREQPMAITMRRPDRIAVSAGTVRLVSDGETLTTVIEPTRSYLREPAPERITTATISEGPLGAMLLGGPGGVPASIVLNLLLADDPAATILEGGVGLRAAPDAEVDGMAVQSLAVDAGVGPDYLLRVDPASKLLRRIDVIVPEAVVEEDAPVETTLGAIRLTWTAGEVRTDAPDSEDFAFEPPIGFNEVKPLRADP